MATFTADEKSTLMETVQKVALLLPRMDKDLCRHEKEIYGNGVNDGMKGAIGKLDLRVHTLENPPTSPPRKPNWFLEHLLGPLAASFITGLFIVILYLIILHPIVTGLVK